MTFDEMFYDPLRAQLLEKLNMLGSTSREVANNLHQAKVMGVRCMGGSCPLANFLRRTYSYSNIHVSQSAIQVGDTRIRQDDIPAAIRQFISEFDTGGYKDLDRTLQ